MKFLYLISLKFTVIEFLNLEEIIIQNLLLLI